MTRTPSNPDGESPVADSTTLPPAGPHDRPIINLGQGVGAFYADALICVFFGVLPDPLAQIWLNPEQVGKLQGFAQDVGAIANSTHPGSSFIPRRSTPLILREWETEDGTRRLVAPVLDRPTQFRVFLHEVDPWGAAYWVEEGPATEEDIVDLVLFLFNERRGVVVFDPEANADLADIALGLSQYPAEEPAKEVVGFSAERQEVADTYGGPQ